MKGRDFSNSLRKIEDFLKTNGLVATCKLCRDCLLILVEKRELHYYANRERVEEYLNQLEALFERPVLLVRKCREEL